MPKFADAWLAVTSQASQAFSLHCNIWEVENITKRIAHYVILLCAMILLNFFFPRLMPGSPITRIASEDATGDVTEEQRARLIEFYNLDKPLGEQFLMFLKNTVTLDWGMSYSKKQPITDLLKSALPWTLLLAGCNLVFSTLIGTALGTMAALRRKKQKDIKHMILLMLLGTLPSFWIGMILISIFSVQLGWFPLYGAYSLWENKEGIAYVLDVMRHLALPVATMVLVSLTIFSTTSRYGVLNTLKQDYIMLAEMRGIPGRRVKVNYIVRNALIPVFTVFMTELGFVLSGSVLIESIFSYPGIGKMLRDAVTARDYPLMQYAFLVTSIMVVFTAFLADVLRRKIDPAMVASHEK